MNNLRRFFFYLNSHRGHFDALVGFISYCHGDFFVVTCGLESVCVYRHRVVFVIVGLFERL